MTVFLVVRNPGVWTSLPNNIWARFANIIGLLPTLPSRSTFDGWNGVCEESRNPLFINLLIGFSRLAMLDGIDQWPEIPRQYGPHGQ